MQQPDLRIPASTDSTDHRLHLENGGSACELDSTVSRRTAADGSHPVSPDQLISGDLGRVR